MVDSAGYVAICYAIGAFVAVAFAVYAFCFGLWWSRKQSGNENAEAFITARGTQSLWRIAWSFYAGAVGAWVIVAPSQYASFSGIVGLVVYALASGIPILIIALFGGLVNKQSPYVVSIADYIGLRFGPVAKTLVFLICLFNMCIALLAEYTTIGAIFSEFVGSVSYGIIILIGGLTLLYTAYGGLAVSIATDQAQGIASVIMAIMLVIYVAVTYRTPIPKPLPEGLGVTEAGWLAIFTLGASLLSSTMFSEAVWQRVWASKDRRALQGGAALGCAAIVVVVFLSGFGGWLALVGGYATFESNPNTYLMQILTTRPGQVSRVDSWVGVIVVLLAIIMNEGAVDSLQNGLACAISAHYLKALPLKWTRVAVILLNIPLIAIGTQGFAVLSLFLVGNLLTCCAICPLIAGLIPALRGLIGETAFVIGIVGGILGVTGSGIGIHWMPNDVAASFSTGVNWAWYANNYDWRPFLAALLCSLGSMVAWSACSLFVKRKLGCSGPGVSGLLLCIPGMKWLTADYDWAVDVEAGSTKQPNGNAKVNLADADSNGMIKS